MLSIEKIIVALAMALGHHQRRDRPFGGLDHGAVCLRPGLSVGAGLAILGWHRGRPAGRRCWRRFQRLLDRRVGLPSLAVTLAASFGFRGVARILLEDRSIGDFPEWFDRLGQEPLIGPFPFSLILFVVLYIIALIVLQYSGFGRYIYVIGNNRDVAQYSGVKVERVKLIIFTASGFIAALAGILFAARLGAVRGDLALGFELDIITMVLLGGVSIFGGSGSMIGVGLSISSSSTCATAWHSSTSAAIFRPASSACC